MGAGGEELAGNDVRCSGCGAWSFVPVHAADVVALCHCCDAPLESREEEGRKPAAAARPLLALASVLMLALVVPAVLPRISGTAVAPGERVEAPLPQLSPGSPLQAARSADGSLARAVAERSGRIIPAAFRRGEGEGGADPVAEDAAVAPSGLQLWLRAGRGRSGPVTVTLCRRHGFERSGPDGERFMSLRLAEGREEEVRVYADMTTPAGRRLLEVLEWGRPALAVVELEWMPAGFAGAGSSFLRIVDVHGGEWGAAQASLGR